MTRTKCACARATDQAEVEAGQRVPRAQEGLGEGLEKTAAEVGAVVPGVASEHAWLEVTAQVPVQHQCLNSLAHGRAEGVEQESTCVPVEVAEQHVREMRQGHFPCAELLWTRDGPAAAVGVPFQGCERESAPFDLEHQVRVVEAAREHLWQWSTEKRLEPEWQGGWEHFRVAQEEQEPCEGEERELRAY